MRKHAASRVGLVLALLMAVGLAVGCTAEKPTAPAVDLGTLDASMMIVVGNSLSAGFVSGGLGGWTQTRSYPMLIAEAVGAAGGFEQPTISSPGIPAQLEVRLIAGQAAIVQKSGLGTPTNLTLARPYNNLAVPGATTIDVSTDDGSTPGGLSNVILRGLGTQVAQAISLNPSIILVWVGSNDVLGGAVSGIIMDGVTTVPTNAGEAALTAIFGNLANNTTADILIANIPDVTAVPYVTYLTKGYTSPLTDATGTQTVFPVITEGDGVTIRQATTDDYILLPAATQLALDPTYGGPANPISNAHTLDANEVATLQSRIAFLNNVISTEAASIGATVVDFNAFFNQLLAAPVSFVQGGLDYNINGLFVQDGGIVMSLDGIHPTTTGYVTVANYWIGYMNTVFGADIPPVPYTRTVMPGLAKRAQKVPLEEMPDYSRLQERLMMIYGVGR